jgi:hypothetical protein
LEPIPHILLQHRNNNNIDLFQRKNETTMTTSNNRQLLFWIFLTATTVRIDAWINLFPSSTKPLSKSKASGESSKKTLSTTNRRGRLPPSPPPPPPAESNHQFAMPEIDLPEVDIPNPITPNLWNSATSSLLGLAANFAPKDIKQTPNKAARLTVNSLPPQSVEIDLKDVPIVGGALSGTYAKVRKPASTKPSIQIASPKDKLGAIQTAVDKGNLQFGLDGIFRSSLDIQLQPNQPGVAPVEITSPLIPKWPFGKQKSDWNKVTNMGNGETYYFNSRTGDTQLEKPANL